MKTAFLSLVSILILAAGAGLAEETTPPENPFQKLQPDDLFILKNGELEQYDLKNLEKVEYFGIYFSAHWCPPCRRFTPKLVEFYNEKKRPNFEVILISEDRAEEDMKKYMEETKMPWPTLNFNRAKRFAAAKLPNPFESYSQSGIPNLVFIDKTGKVISASFDENGQYRGPQAVLEDMRKKLK